VFQCPGAGIASTVYRRALGNSALPESIAMFRPLHIPFVSNLPVFGPVSVRQTILFYLTLLLAFFAHFVLFRTNFGLALRHPEKSAPRISAGISVYRMRYAGTLIRARRREWQAHIWSWRSGTLPGIHRLRTRIHRPGNVIFGRWNP